MKTNSSTPFSTKKDFSSQSYDYNSFIQHKDKILTGFSVVHINIQSLKAKYELLEGFLTEIDNIDALCLTETWLTNNNFHCYGLTGYKHIFSIRNSRNGGTSIFVKSDIDFIIREDIKSKVYKDYTFEITIIEIKNKNNETFLLACVYRTPDSPLNDFITHLDILLEMATTEKKQLLIAGDYNVDLLRTNSSTKEFVTTLVTSNFKHLIQQPTRKTKQTSTCIDNFIINDTTSINSAGVLELDLSDHFAIYVDLNLRNNKTEETLKYTHYGRPRSAADEIKFLNFINNEK